MALFRKARGAAAPLHVDHAMWSQPGTYAVNEDATGWATAMGLTLLAVADGLGGHESGEQASRLAIDRAVQLFQRQPSLEGPDLAELILGAHQALGEAEGPHGGHGRTTLVLLASDGVIVRWAHVGDSRLYVFRNGIIEARTRDHSVPELLHRAGDISDDEIRHHPDRSRLLQALGQDIDPKVAISEPRALQDGDAFLLCSDGWWENVSDREMEGSLRDAERPQDWLARMAATITAAAKSPQDNYTAVAAFVAAVHAG